MKIFFCYNLISYNIALYEQSNGSVRSIIYYMPSRVSPRSDGSRPYRTSTAFFWFFVGLLSKKIELVVPHVGGGRVSKMIAKWARNCAYIDDGMDTFRSRPRNMDLDYVRYGQKFYTFDYPIAMASWTKKLTVTQVAPLTVLSIDARAVINLQDVDLLIVESPGIDENSIAPLGSKKVLAIHHPSYTKNTSFLKELPSVSGATHSFEKSLDGYKGKVLVGESMALIYMIATGTIPLANIQVSLNKDQYENLQCLHGCFSQCGSVNVH